MQALKAPKPEPEKPIIPKRPAEARDAREVAKKLLKSGAITAIPKQQKQPEQGFKRPRGMSSLKKHWKKLIVLTQISFCRFRKKINLR